MNIGYGDIEEAELWALFHLLKLVWQMSFKQVVIETDSKLTFEWIAKGADNRHKHAVLIGECRRVI